MREFKFRVWEYDAKEFLYLDPLRGGLFDSRWFIDDEQSVVMQYTGLKDKNGNEIYEGDLVKLHGNDKLIVPVIFGWGDDNEGYSDSYGWCFGSRVVGDSASLDGRTEVIGNIYENPDLLPIHPNTK
jgi:uncharacterized phage protein (TIGR01671 family)